MRTGCLLVAVVGLISGLGCSSESATSPAATAVASTEPALSCPAGTRPSADDGTCAPVGPSMDDVPGFKRDAAGWGYDAIRPAEECKGATLAVLGNSECQPIDDCDAPFPPPNADVVLRPADVAADKRATLLQDTVSAMRSGGTIALDAGDYDPVTLSKSVHLIGRCASKVRIRSSEPLKPAAPGEDVGARGKGIDVRAAVTVELKSIEVEGFEFGVYADRYSANVRLDRMLLSGNRLAVVANNGVNLEMTRSVSQPSADFPRNDAQGPTGYYGSRLTLTEVDIRGMDSGLTAMSPGTTLTFRRSILGYAYKPVYRGCGIQAFRGAKVIVEESFVAAGAGFAFEVGRFLGDPPARDKSAGAGSLEVKRSVLLHDGKPVADVEVHEGILNVWDGGHVDLENTTVRHQSLSAFAVMTGSSLTARTTAFLDDESYSLNRNAISIFDDGSKAELEDSVIVDAQQVAILLRNRRAELTMRRSLITGTKHRLHATFSEIGGSGQAIAAAQDTHVALSDSALVANEGMGIFALDGATLQLEHALIDDTRATPDGAFGTGVFVVGGQLSMSSSVVRRSADTALAFDASSALVTSCALSDNAVAVRTSGGTNKVDANVIPDDFRANEAVFCATRFERNIAPLSSEAMGGL